VRELYSLFSSIGIPEAWVALQAIGKPSVAPGAIVTRCNSAMKTLGVRYP
jgi:hypothetical protein